MALASGSCDPAGTLQVTTTNDGVSGSLRAAISAANSSTRASIRIELSTGIYALTHCGSDDINSVGDLDVTVSAPVTLVGTGPDVVIQQHCDGERVLDDHGSGLLTLQGVTITGGSLTAPSAAEPALGGGVRARGDVVLRSAVIRDNSATGANGSGALAGGAVVHGGAALGGGLYVAGSLTVVNSEFWANLAVGGAGDPAPDAGGIAAAGGRAEGGAAFVAGAISVRGGSMGDNRAIGGIGGTATGAPGGGGSARGGGLAQRAGGTGALSLTDTTLVGNSAEGGASGFASSASQAEPPAGAASGGGLAGDGVLTVSQLTAFGNRALGGSTGRGGCPEESLFCRSSGVAGAARGGALSTSSSASVSASEFTGNSAQSGDAFFTCYGQACTWIGVPASLAAGGAVWAGAGLTLNDSNFARNAATQGNGLPTLDGLAHGGAAASDTALTVAGGNHTGNSVTRGHGGALSGGAVTVSRARFANNTASGRGGAISASTLVAAGIVATQNTAGGTGGGALVSAGDATISDSDILSNRVDAVTAVQGSHGGGGILVGGQLKIARSEVSDNSGQATYRPNSLIGLLQIFTGGGILAASVKADSVTLSDNQVTGYSVSASSYPSIVPVGVSGGAGIAATGAVLLVNSTLSGNVVHPNTVSGGTFTAIPNQGAALLVGSLTLEHATLVDNLGAESIQATNITTHRSVVVAAEGKLACAVVTTDTRSSYNWFSDASCGLRGPTNQQTSAEFLLSPLAENRGPVPTRLPAEASVLIDRIPASACPTRVDARGVSRPQSTACDIGAVEVEPVPAPGPTPPVISLTFEYTREMNGGVRSAALVVDLFNAGPGDAVGTTTQPIQVIFHPAPGLAVQTSTRSFVGSFAPGALPFASASFEIGLDVPTSAELGTFELRPGRNASAPVTHVPVRVADIAVSAQRSAEPQEPGDPTPFNFQVSNNGPSASGRIEVWLSSMGASIAWATSTGSVQAGESGQRWLIPALAPGQTATVSGVASNAGRGASAYATMRVFDTVDFNNANDTIRIDLGPALGGTADLQIQSLVVNQGATSGSRVLRATLVNAGPAAAQADTANPISVWVNVGLNFVSAARALSDGWDCIAYGPYDAGCRSSLPLAAGASAVVEFDMSAQGSPASVQVRATLTPDPLPGNDIRYVDLPYTQ